MEKLKKIFTIIVVSVMLTISASATDTVGFANSVNNIGGSTEIQAGYCVNCGSTLVVDTEFCISDDDNMEPVGNCGIHDSCIIWSYYAVRCEGRICNGCGAVISKNVIPGSSHIECYMHAVGLNINSYDQVCNLCNHMDY